MAVLSAPQRAAVFAQLMRDMSLDHDICSLTKPDLLAAVGAADDWADANAAAFNSALPVAARNALTAAQKARLLSAVVLKRFVG